MTQYQINVAVLDAILEEEMVQEMPNSRLGCFLQYNDQFLDAIMIKGG